LLVIATQVWAVKYLIILLTYLFRRTIHRGTHHYNKMFRMLRLLLLSRSYVILRRLLLSFSFKKSR